MANWLPAVIASLLGFGAAFLAYRQSSRADNAATRVENLRVDAEAYQRAKTLYEAGIRQLEDQLARLQTQLNQERDLSNALRVQINALEDTVAKLRRQLILSGVDMETRNSG